jgi:hypothetical protein
MHVVDIGAVFMPFAFFLGMTCIALGHLVRSPGYLPNVLGLGMQLGGVCSQVHSSPPGASPRLLIGPPRGSSLRGTCSMSHVNERGPS